MLGGVFNTNSDRARPVVACGVTIKRARKVYRRSSRLPVVVFNPAFTV